MTTVLLNTTCMTTGQMGGAYMTMGALASQGAKVFF